MYRNASAIVLLLAGLVPLPCAACPSLDSIQWLLGTWTTASGARRTTETWTQVSEHTFEGAGETHDDEKGERVGSESLRLVAMAGEVFYLAKVGQNPLPVAFRATRCSPSGVTFENATHDFPRRLDYRLRGADLTVEVSDGAGRGFSLHFTRSAAEPRAP